MFLRNADYNSIVSFLIGMDVALEGEFLTGFAGWLKGVTTLGTNLSWPQRVLFVAFPDEKSPWSMVDKGDSEANEKAVRILFDCLDRYIQTRDEET
jgi:hypothetical protein